MLLTCLPVHAHNLRPRGGREALPSLLTWMCAGLCLSGCANPEVTSAGGRLAGRKGAPWTIRCIELTGAGRVSQANELAASLRQTSGIRADDVAVQDEPDGFARVYYGTYFRRGDPRTGRRDMPADLRADLDLIKQLGDPATGQRYFFGAIPVLLPQSDVGEPQWNLVHARGRYSLQVAAFEPAEDFWEFKKAAAEYCEYLRGLGFEAYYHHTPSSSVVTVGTFGPQAVINRREGGKYLTYYSPDVTALQQNELFRYNLLNGRVYSVIDQDGRKVPVPSRLVEIPEPNEQSFVTEEEGFEPP